MTDRSPFRVSDAKGPACVLLRPGTCNIRSVGDETIEEGINQVTVKQ